MASERLLPERIDMGSLFHYSVDHAISRRSGHRGEGERLMAFVLPPFQRPPVWSTSQEVKFIESLALGLPVGTYTYCSAIDLKHTDGWLIDGQQRMRAIQRFITGMFKVFGYRWSALTKLDQLRFRNTVFPAHVLHESSESECLERYIRLNYSGTPHTKADERRAKRLLVQRTTP